MKLRRMMLRRTKKCASFLGHAVGDFGGGMEPCITRPVIASFFTTAINKPEVFIGLHVVANVDNWTRIVVSFVQMQLYQFNAQ